MSGVFISYRRDDSGGYTGRLFDVACRALRPDQTFMDLDDIHGGDNFAAVIDDKVGQCSVLLAVIGERWLTLTGRSGVRRLDEPDDFVRLEIAKALERGVRVIPVLVGGAAMPGARRSARGAAAARRSPGDRSERRALPRRRGPADRSPAGHRPGPRRKAVAGDAALADSRPGRPARRGRSRRWPRVPRLENRGSRWRA